VRKPGFRLRPATLEDAAGVAELQTATRPDDPHDAATVMFWWTHMPDSDRWMRLLAEQDGNIDLYVSASHGTWKDGATRFGRVRVYLHPRSWSDQVFRNALETAESWLRDEQSQTAVAFAREDQEHELTVLYGMGYREVRRERFWELDLVAKGEELVARAEHCRADMREKGIHIGTLEDDPDPDTLTRLYELDLEATEDIPTTVPFPVPTFDEWTRMYFENPGIRRERFWIAKRDSEVVGMSLIQYPPGLGIPATEFTGTSRSVRGLGIARALKYETVAQAIALGATRLRTDNDAGNAPILHLNEEMGYRPVTPAIEVHRSLSK
jgi:GNAT superfamily N-acetyltransferase